MTPAKRVFDVVLSVLLLFLLGPMIACTALVILLNEGRPILYRSERMKTPEQAFLLIKFRTMRVDPADSGVTGADKAARITRTGRTLRRTRLDELPQLWNVLRGDMSFVGPRPPLRRYVEMFPDLYAHVLRSRPGITGLASVVYADHEEALLSRCSTAGETEAAYVRACIPRKARLDLMWQARRTLCFDLAILWQTFRGRLRRR